MANSLDPDNLGLCCLYMLFCPNMLGHCGDVNPKYKFKMRMVWQIVQTLIKSGSALFVHTLLPYYVGHCGVVNNDILMA